jgi:hypothetical protein
MALVWHELPVVLPGDGATVWVRRYWYGSAWLATWSLAAGTFTAASGLVAPWYVISRWRAQ